MTEQWIERKTIEIADVYSPATYMAVRALVSAWDALPGTRIRIDGRTYIFEQRIEASVAA
jgi:hypothetical protein